MGFNVEVKGCLRPFSSASVRETDTFPVFFPKEFVSGSVTCSFHTDDVVLRFVITFVV